jgi:hypothetical protein
VLSATSTRTFGGSTLKSTVFLERRLRAHVVTRDRLLYDAAFAPPSKKASPYVHLFAQLQGTFTTTSGIHAPAPCAFVLAETEFDRVEPGSTTFRSYGAPGEIVEIRLSPNDVRRPVGLAHGAVELPASVWDAYRALASASSRESLPSRRP